MPNARLNHLRAEVSRDSQTRCHARVMRPPLVAVSPNGQWPEHSSQRGGCPIVIEDPRSMLTDRTHQPFFMDDAEPTSDRGMLVLQYLVAAIAVAAAALLALVN